MLGRLRGLFGRDVAPKEAPAREAAPSVVHSPSGAALEFAATLDPAAQFAIPRWEAIYTWIESLPEGERDAAWDACDGAWLLHMRDRLGESFRLDEGKTAVVISSLDPRHARFALEFMERTLKRILRVLDGVARPAPWGKDVLVLFDNADAYYRYASAFNPHGGDSALSSGMYLSRDRGHFISTKADLQTVEPVIAHEMTHACVTHLPIPLWVNEGLAVNTERRVAVSGMPLHTPEQMRLRHLKFWGPAEVQQFWSGRSFGRHDDGNELSYDLARILVEHLSADWTRFAAFANAATYEDGGAGAALEHLALDLGAAVASLLEAGDARPFAPDPHSWAEPPEHEALPA